MPAAIGNPEAAILEECVANCDVVSLRVCITRFVTSVNVDLVTFSTAVHLTSIQPLYDRYASECTPFVLINSECTPFVPLQTSGGRPFPQLDQI